jgi:sulfopyruvate decarboxylase TPP-binding subunit
MVVAEGIRADVVVGALEAVGATDVVIVPDTNQKTVLELLDERARIPVHRAAAEDDVFGICAGLWFAGRRPVAVIQQLGIFAGVNVLRGMVHDQGVPIAILAGMYGRDLELEVEDDPGSAVRLCLPLLEALEVRWTLVERAAEAHRIEAGLSAALDGGRAHAVLLGAPTT